MLTLNYEAIISKSIKTQFVFQIFRTIPVLNQSIILELLVDLVLCNKLHCGLSSFYSLLYLVLFMASQEREKHSAQPDILSQKLFSLLRKCSPWPLYALFSYFSNYLSICSTSLVIFFCSSPEASKSQHIQNSKLITFLPLNWNPYSLKGTSSHLVTQPLIWVPSLSLIHRIHQVSLILHPNYL